MKTHEAAILSAIITASALLVPLSQLQDQTQAALESIPNAIPKPSHETLAASFTLSRWPCEGAGCLDSVAIARLAFTLDREARMTGFHPTLIAGLLMVENPWLDSLAVSHAGAVGLMQVMPMHRGRFEECPGALRSIEGSLCTGVRVLRERILLQYNGCLVGECSAFDDRVVMRKEEF